jgi:hypothetical protein
VDTLRKHLSGWPLALAVYVAVALWVLYPAYLDGDHVLIGDWRHPDMLSNHWLYAWIADRLLAGESILHNTDYYFPIGDHPWLAGNGSDAVLYTPFHAVFGWPGSITAWYFVVLVLNGLAGYGLCRSLGATKTGALFGGATLALSPYVCHELAGGRFSQVPLYAFAGFWALWIKTLDERSWRSALGAALLYGLCAFIYWYYGLWATLVGAITLAWRGREAIKAWPAILVFGLTALLLVVPPLSVFLSNWALIPGTATEVFPHPLALSSGLPMSFPIWGGDAERGEVTTSLIALGLAGWGAWKLRGRLDWRMKAVATCGLLFFLLALGPELLTPGGESTGVPGPFQLAYGASATLRRFWWPYRHVVVVTFALAVFASRALPDKVWLGPLLALLLPLDYSLRSGKNSTPVAWWEPPEAYLGVAELPGEALIELPISPQVATAQQTLIYQKVHGKKLVNGHAMWVDRVRPDAWDAWVAENTFLSTLQQYESGQLMNAPFAFRPEHVVELRQSGVRYLVVNAEYFPRALYGLVERYPAIFTPLFGEPVYTFRDHLYVWDLENYKHQGVIEDVPEFGLPQDYTARDGNEMLDVGHGRALGFRGLARLFPPTIPPEPPKGEPGEMGDDLGAAPGDDRR